jgi:PAS domain S-box-containing protein
MTEIALLSNKTKPQLIGGLMTMISIFFGALLALILPIASGPKIYIFLILVGLISFLGIYSSIPDLYRNEKTRILPAVVCTIGIAGIIFLAGQYGYLFMLFYLLLLATSAFVCSSREHLALVLFSVVCVLLATLYPDMLIEAEYLVGLYILVALSISLRFFANNAIDLETEKQKFAEEIQSLEEDKSEIRELLDSLSDGLIVVSEENKITFINPSALKILGIVAPFERVHGRNINSFLPTIGLNGPESVTKEVFENHQHCIRNDFRLVTPQKTIRLHTNTSPIITEGAKLRGGIVLFRDITDEKINEERQAEFNAVASHELRTPLSVIEGYLYYILDPSSKLQYDKETADYIKRAHEAATELNNLVSDILTVVKSEEGTLEINLKKISPTDLFEKLTHDWEERANAKKIKLKLEIVAHDKIPEITTDPVKVKEIFNNLLGNAIKFTEKGSIKVEIGLLKKEMLVSIKDTGIGVSDKDWEGIFNKFYRAENWQTRKTGGTGLGLYIAKTLVERLGGRIWVDSQVGKGSTFCFTLPLHFHPEKPRELG